MREDSGGMTFNLGEPEALRWDHGPVSFGLILSGAIVSWSEEGAKDLLIGRCWEGLFLYPSRHLTDQELGVDPIQVFPATLGDVYAIPVDWDRDGTEDLLATNRLGFLYFLKRRGEYPSLSFELQGPLREAKTSLCFNLPYENPHHPVLDDLGGYFDRGFFNYLCPIRYPTGDPKTINLIIGDWAGNLWWLPDQTSGTGQPEYRGVPYDKRDEDLPTAVGKNLVQQYGHRYVKPEETICDERGQPFLLGEGSDVGGIRYPGGNARPVVYRNGLTGSEDLLVLAGTVRNSLYYLQRTNPHSHDKPAFRNFGEVRIHDMDSEWHRILYMHSKLIVVPASEGNDLMMSFAGRIAVLRNKRLREVKPEFEFSHWISGTEAMAGCNCINEILNDEQGRRYTVESWGNSAECREILDRSEGIRFSADTHEIKDQNGVFTVEGETDPQGGKDWGWHRVAKWDYDRSGRQHLIVATDRGLLYLLIDEPPLMREGHFHFRSVGPLQDCHGRIIKIHNRAIAAGIDLKGEGLEDLLVGGCSYQAGIAVDPVPGGGVYYVINKGMGPDGVPILDTPRPVDFEGYEVNPRKTNSHVHLQTLDVDQDGEKEAVIVIQWQEPDKGYVFKPLKDRIGLRYTGMTVPQTVEHWLLDLDNDGQLESVFAGSENGVGNYRKLIAARVNQA